MKVVIADDSIELRKRIIAMLSDIEAIDIIGQAENVKEAIDAISQLRPDVVILDIRMPGGSGVDVLKSIAKTGRIPIVIMLTNHPHAQYRTKCFDAGADFFFDKSTEFEKIIDVFTQIAPGDNRLSSSPAV